MTEGGSKVNENKEKAAELADKPGSVVDSHSSTRMRHRSAQATYPDLARAAPWGPYLVLLQVGFAVPVRYRTRGALLPHRLAPWSTRDVGGIFLLHCPSARAAQALPGTLPCGARTFLGAPQGKQEQIPRSNDATVRPTPPLPMMAQMPSACPCGKHRVHRHLPAINTITINNQIIKKMI